jgi:ABC-type multidrug transport system ATPase subunit
LDAEDKEMSRLNNMVLLLGLQGCRNTYVGDEMIRGISGGQKRRVTLGEMLIPARNAKFMDCITNGNAY